MMAIIEIIDATDSLLQNIILYIIYYILLIGFFASVDLSLIF